MVNQNESGPNQAEAIKAEIRQRIADLKSRNIGADTAQEGIESFHIEELTAQLGGLIGEKEASEYANSVWHPDNPELKK